MAETNAPLARTTIYAHGILALPLSVIGYPLAIWIPAHSSSSGILLACQRLEPPTSSILPPALGQSRSGYGWVEKLARVTSGLLLWTYFLLQCCHGVYLGIAADTGTAPEAEIAYRT
jgi:hypothetical protein